MAPLRWTPPGDHLQVTTTWETVQSTPPGDEIQWNTPTKLPARPLVGPAPGDRLQSTPPGEHFQTTPAGDRLQGTTSSGSHPTNPIQGTLQGTQTRDTLRDPL